MTSFDASSELTMNVALCACGALGYYVTKWANRRLFMVRLPAQKVLTSDEEEARCTTCSIDRQDDGCRIEACEPESEPTTVAVVASSASSRKARRRSARQAKVAVAAVVKEVAEPEAVNFLNDEEQEIAEVFEAASVENVEATEECEAENAGACNNAEDVPIFDVSLPEPAANVDDEVAEVEQMEEEEEEEQQPVVSDRVARLMAKKAARKERKAQERQQLAEQLEAPTVEKTEVDEKTDLLEAEPEVDGSDMSQSARSAIEAAADATTEEGEEEKEDEEVVEEEHMEAAVAVKAKEAEGEEIADGVETDAEASEQEELTEEVQVDNSDKLQAFGLSSVKYTPIMSPDGQQLYTDGQQVYIMACVQLDDALPSSADIDADAVAAAAASVDAPENVIAITDPSSPWHRVALDLGVTSEAGVTSQAEENLLAALSPGVQPMAAAMGPPPAPMPPFMAPQVIEPNPDVDVLGFPAPPMCSGFPAAPGPRCPPIAMEPTVESDEDDMLWDVCWELIV